MTSGLDVGCSTQTCKCHANVKCIKKCLKRRKLGGLTITFELFSDRATKSRQTPHICPFGHGVQRRLWHRTAHRLLPRNRRSGFGGKAPTRQTVGAKHLYGGQHLGLETHEVACIGQPGVPADGKMPALVAIGLIAQRLRQGQRRFRHDSHSNRAQPKKGQRNQTHHCSSFITDCCEVLACAKMAVAAC